MNPCKAATVAAVGAWMSLMSAGAVAQSPDAWQFSASINVYLPTMGGTTKFLIDSGTGVSMDAGTILENLKFTFMGSFDARTGRWGGFTDLIYIDLGNTVNQTKALTIGGTPIPADASASATLDMKGAVWTLGGYYRVVDGPAAHLDAFAGVRMLDLTETLDWNITGNVGSIPLAGRAGHAKASRNDWDGLIGIKGQSAFGAGRKWVAPYYLDVGTGSSDLTWQAMAGVGYSFSWGEVIGAWRYIGYEMKSGEPIQDLFVNGPMVSAVFRW